MEVPDTPTPEECSDWNAWYDHEPPGPATLKVTGKCRFSRTSYEVDLRRQEQQGISPKNLLLERTVTEVEEGWADAETSRQASYEEKTDFKYGMVAILPDNVTVVVEKVH